MHITADILKNTTEEILKVNSNFIKRCQKCVNAEKYHSNNPYSYYYNYIKIVLIIIN